MGAFAKSFSCRVSTICAFCWPTTETPSIINCLVAVVHTKPVIANFITKLVAMATSIITCGRHVTQFLGPIQAHNPNGISLGSAVCTQTSTECSCTLHMDAAHLKIASSHGVWTSYNTWVIGPMQVLNPNGISISSALFAGLTSVTNRLTDHATRSSTLGLTY